jgi:2-polyprenyl-6-methoxyphenol hydroxylase-like FAD-dependent oxidoreductase
MTMASIIVCGGGVIGLAAATMLARDRHQVTVLEADSESPPAPAAAWERWQRPGVAQFRQPHNLFPRFRQVCEEELPDLPGRLAAAGCRQVDPLGSPADGGMLPPSLSDHGPRDGDEAFRYVTGRRPAVESVVAAVAAEQPGVVIRRGVRVAGLIAGPPAIPGVPHVAGVRTSAGQQLGADRVVDAMGRRSRGARLLTALGARPPHAHAETSGFAYYTRYFTGPSQPLMRGPVLTPLGTMSVLTLYGDNGTWSVTIYAASQDAPVKALRDSECFARVIRACPLQAHWLDGQPVTGVLPMAGITDRYHRFVIDGTPVATGFAAVGDAWACTDPSGGRGVSIGIIHAQLLRQTARRHLGYPAAFARAWDEGTERHVAPFYRNQIAADQLRLAEMTALREGRPWSPPDSPMTRLARAAAYDPGAFRAFLATVMCLALPQDVLTRPDITDTLERIGDKTPPPFPGPDRQHLLQLLAGTAVMSSRTVHEQAS